MGIASMLGALALGPFSGIIPLATLGVMMLIYLKLERIEDLLMSGPDEYVE